TPWLARRFGTLPAYQAALAGFIVASACCAFAPTVGVLIATRVLQGLAGAPMVPLAMGLLLGKGTGGVRTMPVSAGLLLFAAPAPARAIGALLTSQSGGGWFFLTTLPRGIAAWAGVQRGRGALAGGGARGARLDLAGLLLLAAGLALATYGASQGPGRGWLSAAAAPAWTGGAGPAPRGPPLARARARGGRGARRGHRRPRAPAPHG